MTVGLIWQTLYPLIPASFGFLFVQPFRQKLPWRVVLPFALNLLTNLISAQLQFGIRNLPIESPTDRIASNHDRESFGKRNMIA